MKKRVMSLLLTVAMIMSMIVVPTAAADTPTITIGSASGKPGEEISIDLSFSGLGSTELSCLGYVLKFDPAVLTYVGMNTNKSNWDHMLHQVGDPTANGTIGIGAFANDSYSGDDTFATFTFKINEGVTAATTNLTIDLPTLEVYDLDEEPVDTVIVDGSVTVNTSDAPDVPTVPTITIGSASGKPGEEISIDLDFSGLGSTELSCLGYVLKFDPAVLTYVGMNTDKSNWDHMLHQVGDPTANGTIGIGAFASDSYSGDDTFATFTFKINEGVTASTTNLTIDLPTLEVYDLDEEPVDTVIVDGSVTVDTPAPPAYIPAETVTITAEQISDTRVTLSGEFAPADADVDKVYIYYGEDPNNLALATNITWTPGNNTFYTTVDVNEGATVHYQAVVANMDDSTTESDIRSITLTVAPRPTSIEIDENSGTYTEDTAIYSAIVKDQNGSIYTGTDYTVKWSLKDPVEGVTIDENTGLVTVDFTECLYNAGFTLEATLVETNSTHGMFVTIPRDNTIKSIEIVDVGVIDVPTLAEVEESGAKEIALSLTGTDKYGVSSAIEADKWEIDGAEGVTIEGNVIYISNTAETGFIPVTATYGALTDDYDLQTKREVDVASSMLITGPNSGFILPGKTNELTGFNVVEILDQYGTSFDDTTPVGWTCSDNRFTFADGTLTIPADIDNCTVTLTAQCGNASASINVALTKTDIIVSWPTVTAIDGVYGDKVSDFVSYANDGSVTLNGEDIPGTFSLDNADAIPNAGQYTWTIRFMSEEKLPSGEPVYSEIKTGTITIGKQPVSVEWLEVPSGNLTYGADIGCSVEVKNAAGTVIPTLIPDPENTVGTHTVTVSFTEDADENNYELSNNTYTYTVNKADLQLPELPVEQFRIGTTGETMKSKIAEKYDFFGINGVNETVYGTITVDSLPADVSTYPVDEQFNVNVTFTPSSAFAGNYNPCSGTITIKIIDKLTQTIGFDLFGTYEYGSEPLVPQVYVREGNKNGEVTYSVSGDALVFENGKFTIVKAGTATITVTVAGNDEYADGTYVEEVEIGKALVYDYQWENIADREFNGQPSTVKAFYIDFFGNKIYVDVENSDQTNAGTYTATVADFEHDNYACGNQAGQEYTITKKLISEITWAGHVDLVYNGQPVSVTASYTDISGQPVAVTVTNGDQTNAGTYTATVAAFEHDNYKMTAEAAQEYTIAQKAVTVLFKENFRVDKHYDGKLRNFYAELAQPEDAELVGIEDGDEVSLDFAQSFFVFPYKAANDNDYTVTASFALTGADAVNYTISEHSEQTCYGKIQKNNADGLKDKISIQNNSITAGSTPTLESDVLVDAATDYTVEYGTTIPKQDAVDCGHTGENESNCKNPGDCDHRDECGQKDEVAEHFEWSTTVPTTPGSYKVRVVLSNVSVEADSEPVTGYEGKTVIELEEALTVVSAYSGGGGGGGTPSYATSVEKSENGSISLSNKYAAKGKEVTITVNPDEGYELKAITVVDSKGNEIAVTLKNGQYTFVMPATKVTVSAEFAKIADTCLAEKFGDLDTTAWYHEAVDYVLANGIMTGVSANKFAPAMNLTRGMVVQMLWAMEGKPVVNYAMSFTDVAADAWYAEAVRWAAAQGIVSGYSANLFGANDAVTREQMAVMLYGYARYKGADLSVGENTNILSYTDALSISDWAFSGLQWACGEGILSGKTGGYLDPTGTATRMEAAQMLMKFSAALAD